MEKQIQPRFKWKFREDTERTYNKLISTIKYNPHSINQYTNVSLGLEN